jgi:hypothetical protein
MMRINVAGLLLLLQLSTAWAQTPALQIEALELGESNPAEQVYNLQEMPEVRVFARSAAGFKKARIMLQARQGPGWSAPRTIEFSDPLFSDTDPHLSADGLRLSFISDRGGQLDLYESRWEQDRWGAPQRLSEAWQSGRIELGPERIGGSLYFSSTRAGAGLQIYRAEHADQPAQPLPAPINEGRHNSDFTISPDGRYALWWSDRAGPEGGRGDIFLAERIGEGFGPARRLPAPINGPFSEITPSISADGQWLSFASDRPDAAGSKGLMRAYRTSWPALLAALATPDAKGVPG